jgi:hypothetical protein
MKAIMQKRDDDHPVILFLGRWFMQILVVITIAFCTGSASLFLTVRDLTGAVKVNTEDIKSLQSELNAIRTNSITRSELLEILKRVEQQLEIMTLKAKVQEKIKLTGEK